MVTVLLSVEVPLTVNEDKLPTLVSDEAVTPDANVVPVKVPAAAVTVPLPPREIAVPFTVTLLFTNPLFGMFVMFIPLPLNPIDDETFPNTDNDPVN
jgi:hypothetical protein